MIFGNNRDENTESADGPKESVADTADARISQTVQVSYFSDLCNACSLSESCNTSFFVYFCSQVLPAFQCWGRA